MKKGNKLLILLLSLTFVFAVVFTTNKLLKNKVYADSFDIENETGITFSTKESVNFNGVSNWTKKMLIFDIKTDGSETKLQLKGTSGGSGILRSKPDRGDVHTADLCAFENIASSPYWAPDCYSVSLGDGWYRWAFKLSELKKNDISNTVNGMNCLQGNNVQIKNLKFADVYCDVNSYGYLPVSFSNWKNETIQFDAKVIDNNQRRFQLCTSSGSGLTGFVAFDKNGLYYENPNYESGVNDWMLTYEVAPISLGDDWYRYTFDLNLVVVIEGKSGSETADRIKNLTSTNGLNIEMRNFFLIPKEYDMAWELGDSNDELAWNETNGYIDNWINENIVISFDYFGDPVGNFSFATTSSDRATNKFVFSSNGKIKCGDKECGTYTESSLGNGWMHASINLYEVGQYGASQSSIKYIRCDGSGTLFVKNFSSEKLYNPATDADLVLKSNDRTDIPDIKYWSLSKISFEVYHNSLDLASEPQFIFGEKGTEKNITGYFGYCDIGGLGLNLENAKYVSGGSESYWIKSTNQPVEVGDGWYKWTIDLTELRISNSLGAETIGNIYNRGSKDVYIRNFTVESVGDPSVDADLVLKSKERTTIPDIPLWGITTISFEIYHGSLDQNVDPQFIFGLKGSDRNVTSYFGYKDIGGLGLKLTNPRFTDGGSELYWINASTQPIAISGGWYKWVIDLSELKATGGAIGSETIGNIHNRGAYDVFIRNFKIESVKDPSKDADLTLPKNIKTVLPISIPYWQYSTISFEVYHPTLNTIEDPQFQLFVEGNDACSTGFFGYSYIDNEYGLYVRNADKTGKYWVKSTNQPVEVGDGWYKWTINLEELGVGEKTTGTETLGKILNRRDADVYIRNFEVETNPFVLLDSKEIIVPFENTQIKERLNARIINGDGELVYSSSNDEVASVDSKGVVTIKKIGEAIITVSVSGNDEINPAVCKISSLGLKNYAVYNLDEFTDGETSIDFPLVTSKDNNIKYYEYDEVEDGNPSVVVRFLASVSFLEQNRQAFTIWGAKENPLFDGNYGLWAVCYNGALVFDIFGNNGEGGLNVNGINTTALNSHNTLVQSMKVLTDYYIEVGAIDLAELINNQQYSYFYIKVNGKIVWSTLGVAEEQFRNPIIAFTAAGASRCTVKKVDLVTLTLDVDGVTSRVEVANGLKLPEPDEPEVVDDDLKFIGWKKTDGTFFDFDREYVDGDLTLIAEITSDYYTINYDINYDDKGIFDTKYVGYNMGFKEPLFEPSREGYRFKWWSKEENGNAFQFGTPTTSDFTLYAVWVKTHKVSFVCDGVTYLTVYYDEGASIIDPGWGYQDKPGFGKWENRGMFDLNEIANTRAPYYTLSDGGERVDFTKTNIIVNEEMTVYINFMEVETVRENNEEYSSSSKWDYVSLRDLSDATFKVNEYGFTKYDTSTSTYTPSNNNTTDSLIFQGELLLGEKFDGVNLNIGVIGIRSSLNVYNSINIWLRTKEVYLETRENNNALHLAFESFENVEGISEFIKVTDGVSYLKTNVYIPIEFGILSVITPGFEDYDRVFFKINGHTVFDCIIPKYGKINEDPTYRVGFVTDGDTATNSALIVKGVYPKFNIEFKDVNGNNVQDPIILEKYSIIDEPSYKLPKVEGKEFAGWYNEYTNLMWNFKKDRVTAPMILIPTYGYKVILDPNNGGFTNDKSIKEDDQFDALEKLVGENRLIDFPVDPIRSEDDELEYVFGGWEKEDGTLWDPLCDTVTGDITLKARWDIYVTVTYWIDEGLFEWEHKTIKKGSIVGPSKYGDPDASDALFEDDYVLIGWYIMDEKGDYIKVDLDTYVCEYNTDFYAIFDNGEGKKEEEKDDDGEDEEKDDPKPAPVRYGCVQGSGCTGSIFGTLALVSIGLFTFSVIKKKENNKE